NTDAGAGCQQRVVHSTEPPIETKGKAPENGWGDSQELFPMGDHYEFAEIDSRGERINTRCFPSALTGFLWTPTVATPTGPVPPPTSVTRARERTAAPGAGFLWLGLIDCQGTALQFVAIESFNGRLSFLVVVHFHEAESPRSSGEFVRDDVD